MQQISCVEQDGGWEQENKWKKNKNKKEDKWNVEGGERMDICFHRASWWDFLGKGRVSKVSKEGGGHAEI